MWGIGVVMEISNNGENIPRSSPIAPLPPIGELARFFFCDELFKGDLPPPPPGFLILANRDEPDSHLLVDNPQLLMGNRRKFIEFVEGRFSWGKKDG